MKPKVEPDYTRLGFADRMGSRLRALVEQQLTDDLEHYKVYGPGLKFDWSESCIEGHHTNFLDGSVENFSGITVFNIDNDVVADGWMEFVHEGDFFLAYWEFVRTWAADKKLKEKKAVGIPEHIWKKLPEGARTKFKDQRL